MSNRVPSLQSLLILDAAVKHGSFTRAAESLSLTHGAVSQQVKRIESLLGVRLFLREGQGMRPTGTCLALVGQVRQALALLDRAFTTPPRRVAHRRLTISVLPHFATGWLIPRLPAYETSARRVAIDLVGSHLIEAPGQRGIDASVRFGPGNWPSVVAEKLSGEVAFPVCAPSFREKLLPLGMMDRGSLLRSPFPPWEPWLQAAGIHLPAPPDGRSFGDPSLLLAAVREGQGIGMARRLIVAEDLRHGRLVRPFDIEVEEPYGYYLVWRPDSPRSRQIREFSDWLKAEIGATNDELRKAA